MHPAKGSPWETRTVGGLSASAVLDAATTRALATANADATRFMALLSSPKSTWREVEASEDGRLGPPRPTSLSRDQDRPDTRLEGEFGGGKRRGGSAAGRRPRYPRPALAAWGLIWLGDIR